MSNHDIYTAESFAHLNPPPSWEEIVKIVQGREKGEKDHAVLVVSVRRYSTAEELIAKLGAFGIRTLITEGGVSLSIESMKELEAAQKVVSGMGLEMQIDKTNKVAGREIIHELNEADRKRKAQNR